MATELTPAEKIEIAQQHMRNVLYSQYNVSLSLIEANASAKPNADTIASLNAQDADITAQIAALQKEIDAQTAASTSASN